MKRIKFSKPKFIFALLLPFSLCIGACNQEKDIMVEDRNGPVTVAIHLDGKVDVSPITQPSIKGTTEKPLMKNSPEIVLVNETPYNEDYNIVTTISEGATSVQSVTKVANHSSKHAWNTTADTSEPATDDVLPGSLQYYLMVFDSSTGLRIPEYGTNTPLVRKYTVNTQNSTNGTGLAGSIKLDGGKNYTFVAVANLSSATNPPILAANITHLNDNMLANPVLNTQDVLYFSISQYVGNASNSAIHYVNANFRHVNSMLRLKLNASPEMGSFYELSASVTGSGSVNLACNGAVLSTGNTDPYVNKADGSNFKQLSKAGNVFIPATGTSGAIATSGWALISSAGNEHTLKIATVGMGSQLRTDIPDIVLPAGTFKPGVRYTVNQRFEPTGIRIGKLIWARGNLAYDWKNDHYFNRSYAHETGRNYKDTDYWPWGVTGTTDSRPKPKREVGETDATCIAIPFNAAVVDPCTLISGGKWRMPTVNDYRALGPYKVHNGSDLSGVSDGRPTTTFSGGLNRSPDGDNNINQFPYIYFEGTPENGGKGNGRLLFFKSGRYYGRVTASNMSTRDANNVPTGGGNNRYIADRAVYMISDARNPNYGYNPTSAFLGMAEVWSGYFSISTAPSAPGTGIPRSFLNDRRFDTNFGDDDRAPIRCVKNP